jgi:hypothetical protein
MTRHFGMPQLALLLILLVSAGTAAATSSPQMFVAVQAPHPMALDPQLRDPAWAQGAINGSEFENLTTREPAVLPTSVSLLYDRQNLYIGFKAEQTGVPITATQTTNDVGFGLDDFVGVAIDTTGAGNDVYFFETTPKGVRYQQANENVRYDPRWQSAAQVDGSSWTAQMIIPLNVLRIRPGAQNSWRLNFFRSIVARNEHYTWCFNGLMADGQVGQTWPAFTDARYWPTFELSGLSAAVAARPKPRAEMYGLESAGSERNQFEQANGTFLPQNVRTVGVDVTVPVTATVNLVGTLNPDFSNVETDQQTIVPQEFRRGLQENRPFFAQGATFFNPGSLVEWGSPTSPNNQEFYSPDIGPFDRGASLEGTFGMQAFGILSFRGFDASTGNTFDDTAYGYQHALNDQSFEYWLKGVLAHHSLAGDDATNDFGVLEHDYKSGWMWAIDHSMEHGSWVPDTHVADSSVGLLAIHKPNYLTFIAYGDISPNYNPIDGFTFNSDIHGFQAYLNTTGAPTWAKNDALTVAGDRFFDRSGAIHEADAFAQLAATFKNGFSIDGLGPADGVLRSYDIPENSDCTGPTIGSSFFTGFPCYLNGQNQRFNLFQSAFGYKDGTPAPIDASTSWGPFGANYTHLYSISTSRPLGQRFSLGLEYDGTDERSFATGELDSQWLRRVSLGESLGPDSNVSLSLRSINGLGGFSPSVGTDVALAYHRRFSSGNELFVNYGTPAAYATVHRFIVKYVLHTGGAAGT